MEKYYLNKTLGKLKHGKLKIKEGRKDVIKIFSQGCT